MTGSDADPANDSVAENLPPHPVLDLSALRSNVEWFGQTIADHGKRWRPHFAMPPLREIVEMLRDHGVDIFACASVAEAEVLIGWGADDVRVVNPFVDPESIRRFVRLTSRHRVSAVVDHFVPVEMIRQEQLRAGKAAEQPIVLLVEIDLDRGLSGCRPGKDAVQLARAIQSTEGMRFGGLRGSLVHFSHERDNGVRDRRVLAAIDRIDQTRDQLHQIGIPCETVAVGDSGSLRPALTHPVVTEVRPGGGLLGDLWSRKVLETEQISPALTLATRVISRPNLNRAVLGCGSRHLSVSVPPELLEFPSARLQKIGADQSAWALSGEAMDLCIGQAVRLRPGSAVETLLRHQSFFVEE